MNKLLVFGSTAFAISTLSGAALMAEERSCTGALGAVTLDNLRVPSGATCTLTRVCPATSLRGRHSSTGIVR